MEDPASCEAVADGSMERLEDPRSAAAAGLAPADRTDGESSSPQTLVKALVWGARVLLPVASVGALVWLESAPGSSLSPQTSVNGLGWAVRAAEASVSPQISAGALVSVELFAGVSGVPQMSVKAWGASP